MTNQTIDVEADEIQFLADQLKVNPADGSVRISEAANGSLVAEWTSGGQPASVGPTTTHPAP